MSKILNLGKIIFFIIFLSLNLHANVTSYLDTNTAIKGDVLSYTIKASGKDIVFPDFKQIAGNKIINRSSSSSMNIINGAYSKQQIMSYQFVVQTNTTIPSYEIEVDGKKFQTKIHHINIKEPTASKDGDDFQLKLLTNKTTAYVGEAINLTMKFKYKTGLNVVDLQLQEFKQKHFWIKGLKSSDPIQKGEYNIITQEYIVFPQKSGQHKLDNQMIKVAIQNSNNQFGLWGQVKWKKVYSNDLKLDVQALPNGVDIQGDYTLDVNVDKTTTEANKPINLTVNIKGAGNIDDIDEIKLDLKDQQVYSTKPQLKAYLENRVYKGEFTQKFSIVSENDFTIQPIVFKYFDIESKTIKVLKSKAIDMKVKKESKLQPKIETNDKSRVVDVVKQASVPQDSTMRYIYLVVGIIIGLLISFLFIRKRKDNKPLRPIDIMIKKAKNDKELYEILLPYSYQIELKDIMKQLEENIYNNGKNKINRKDIISKVVPEIGLEPTRP